MDHGGTIFNTIDDVQVSGKRVLIRVDLNVPLKDGEVSDATRIERVAPTIRELADKGAMVIVLSHFGRPGGKPVADMSLAPLVAPLADALGRPVAFAANCVGAPAAAVVGGLEPGGIVLLENLRFHPGEEANDSRFAAALAELGEIYVDDAFSAAHRAHASLDAITHHLPAFAGRAMQAELEALGSALEAPRHPLAAVIGGAKVSTKLALLGNLTDRADKLIIGGGMANTFLHAFGVDVGQSLCERELADTAREIQTQAVANGCEIILPVDAVVAPGLDGGAQARTVGIDAIPEASMILDIGPASVALLVEALKPCRTVVWNGPLGAFEFPPFEEGTVAVARSVAAATKAGDMLSVAGGGDTVAALAMARVTDDFSYVSTAGGAFLEWLEGKELPGVHALAEAAR
ncbi:MAG: phosphoglycerate kinase [Alphaproteobacteria bacterium]|nr:phosphoglycerate kinase [Alphaproteobacteria bacterium]